MSELICRITLPWMPSLLVNTAYRGNDMKRGHTAKCVDAMWQIKMMAGPAIGYDWEWDKKRRIDVLVTLWNHASADPDGLTKSIDDALEIALSTHEVKVDDKNFDTHAVGRKDDGGCRIEIELSYREVNDE